MPLLWGETTRFSPPSDPEAWFDLKELSSGEDDAVWEAVVKAETDAAADLRLSLRVTMLNRERVRRSIVAWSYMHDGQPVPLTEENIDRLDRDTYADLVAKVDELSPLVAKTSASKNGSSPGTAATATTGHRQG